MGMVMLITPFLALALAVQKPKQAKPSGLERKVKQVNVVEDVKEINEVKYVVEEKNSNYSDNYVNPNQITENGIAIIKEFEGFQDEPYLDVKHMAIGYGHGIKANEKFTKISEKKANDLLDEDLDSIEKAVSKYVKVPLTQNQYDALVSFTYNFNEKKFKNSTLLKKLNNKDYSGAAEEFKRWVHVYENGEKKALNGLVRRRKVEYDLFNRE